MMKITSFGHCCLLIEEGGVRLLTDPGSFSAGFTDLTGLDAILITHEHMDHLDIPAVKVLGEKNPGLRILANHAVRDVLSREEVPAETLEDSETLSIKDLSLSGLGKKHALMHESMPIVPNTGYFIGPRLFYPGDALTIPNKPVEILALPLMAPWMKLGETIDYLIAVKPATAFPVHDALLKDPEGLYANIVKRIATEHGIRFETFGGAPIDF